MVHEQRKISYASATLKELRRVRTLLELPMTEGEEDAGSDEQGLQQAHLGFDIEGTQIFDTPLAQVFDMSRYSGGRVRG